MNLELKYKNLKYKHKLKESLKNKKYIEIIKHYEHFKYHILQGGYNDIKYNFISAKSIIEKININTTSEKNTLEKLYENIIYNNLNLICSETNECIAYDLEIKKIKKYFDNFQNFNHVKEYEIISCNNNAFIYSICYEKNNYIVNSILKSSTEEYVDNLFYEYLVGNFLNSQLKYFPCFIETYGLYMYENKDDWEHIKKCNNINTCDISILKKLKFINDSDVNIDEYIKKSCEDSINIAVLTQSLKESFNIMNIIDNIFHMEIYKKYIGLLPLSNDEKKKINDDIDDIINKIIYILFQIYTPLSALSEIFTHYNLHMDNILIFEPVQDKVIKYKYHIDSTEKVEFLSPYIVKIINYGKCYFDDGKIDSKIIIDKVCNTPQFKIHVLNKELLYHYYNNEKKNISYDLLLLYLIKEQFEKLVNINFLNIKNNILYTNILSKLRVFDNLYHIIENKDIVIGEINNVKDAFRELKNILMDSKMKEKNNNLYGSKEIILELDIYVDKSKEIKYVNK